MKYKGSSSSLTRIYCSRRPSNTGSTYMHTRISGSEIRVVVNIIIGVNESYGTHLTISVSKYT